MNTSLFIPNLKSKTNSNDIAQILSTIEGISTVCIDLVNYLISFDYESEKNKKLVKDKLKDLGLPSLCQRSATLKSARSFESCASKWQS